MEKKQQLSLESIKIMWNSYLTERSKNMMFLMMGIAVVSVGLHQVEPLLITRLIENVEQSPSSAVNILLLMVGLMFFSRICNFCFTYLREIQWGEDFVQIRLKVCRQIWKEKSVSQVMESRDKFNVSYIESMISKMGMILDRLRFGALYEILSLAISFCFLAYIEKRAAYAMFAYLVVHAIWVTYCNKKIRIKGEVLEKGFRKFSTYFSERIRKPNILMQTGVVDRELHNIESQAYALVNKDRKLWVWYGAHSEVRHLLGHLLLFGTIYHLVQDGVTNSEALWIFPIFMYMQSIVNKAWRIDEMQRVVTRSALPICEGFAIADKDIDIVVAQDGIPFAPDDFESLEFKDVSYQVGGKMVLKDINLCIKKGESIGVFGLSGSGKSTIMKLIQRHADPTSGLILLNGKDIRKYDLSLWQQATGVVDQDNALYAGTLKSVVMYSMSQDARARVVDKDIYDVLASVQLSEKIDARHGLETKVLGDGVNLSGGEKQRLVIAGILLRLQYQDIGLLLLDEATSALDDASQTIIQDAINVIQTKIASFVIAHRMSTLEKCTSFVRVHPCHKQEEQLQVYTHFSQAYKPDA